ncbi:MAG TPA: hypothetical protein PK620_15340 [Denitromonas sp.]|nr:hypothetical protein [Rhodocyclaceae bacterium]HQV16286.1 hypothetical protein [Denitromonas sp.]
MPNPAQSITTAGIQHLAAGTPVTLIGSRKGYAIAVGTADRVRWLHTTCGTFRLFRSLEHAAALLKKCGIHRYAIDTTGGTPT